MSEVVSYGHWRLVISIAMSDHQNNLNVPLIVALHYTRIQKHVFD